MGKRGQRADTSADRSLPSSSLTLNNIKACQKPNDLMQLHALPFSRSISFLFSAKCDWLFISVSKWHIAEEFLWRKLGALWSEKHCILTHFLFLFQVGSSLDFFSVLLHNLSCSFLAVSVGLLLNDVFVSASNRILFTSSLLSARRSDLAIGWNEQTLHVALSHS